MVHASQIIMLYTLNLYCATCQLYLNQSGKTGKEKENNLIKKQIKILKNTQNSSKEWWVL